MTQSKQVVSGSQGQIRLDVPGLKSIVAKFDGGAVCSDGGLLLLRKADARLGLTELASFAIGDNRRPEYIRHSIGDMLKQRIYGIAAGYEDCNDAGQLRFDAMHKLAVGRELAQGCLSHLNRVYRALKILWMQQPMLLCKDYSYICS